MYTKIPDLIMKDCRITHKNFEGRKTEFNAKGNRNFDVVIPAEMVNEISGFGWPVRAVRYKNAPDDAEPTYLMNVRVKYDSTKPPQVHLVTSRKNLELDEESVGTIDGAEIVKVDLVLHPHFWDVSGKQGIKPYLKIAYITIAEDPFAADYENIGAPEY